MKTMFQRHPNPIIFLIAIFIVIANHPLRGNEDMEGTPNNSENQNTIWIFVEQGGTQCHPADPRTLEDALDTLTNLDITYIDFGTCSRVVCSACGCPYGVEFLSLIYTTDLEKAKTIGWLPFDFDSCAYLSIHSNEEGTED